MLRKQKRYCYNLFVDNSILFKLFFFKKVTMTVALLSMFSFFSFGKQKILDLGAIEIKGEIRRPNVKLVHSKKYFNKAIGIVAEEELKEFEKNLLKPVQPSPVLKKRD